MNELEKIELLKKYKELLDLGIISAEEFEKKKELLLNDAEDESKQTEEPVAEEIVAPEEEQTTANYELLPPEEVEPVADESAAEEAPKIAEEVPAAPAQGMKWYKFLINGALFVLVGLFALDAVSTLEGLSIGFDLETLSEATIINMLASAVFGVSYIGCALLALFSRFGLAAKAKSGPRLLYAFCAVVGLVKLFYGFTQILLTVTFGEFSLLSILYYCGITVVYFVGAVVLLILNMVYFSKRRDIFCN